MLFIFFITLTIAQNSNPTCNNAYCFACNADKVCTECIKGYLLVNGQCKYMREENCNKVYNSQSDYCLECLDGYKIDFTTKKCVAGKEICTTVSSSNNKFECSEYLCGENEVKSKKGCIDCSANKYCAKVSDDATDCSTCLACKNGAKLVNGKCELLEYCATIKTSSGTNGAVYSCTKCAGGYVLGSDGKCTKGTFENCLEYDNNGKCQKCLNDNAIMNGKCTNKCPIQHCKHCYPQSTSDCKECEEGYQWEEDKKTFNDICFKLPDNCKSGYRENGTVKCTGCIDGYGFNQSEVCVKRGEGCVGHGVYAPSCIVSSGCKPGYYLEGDKCVPAIEHCMRHTSKDKCQICENGYYLDISNYKCLKCADHCKTCSSSAEYCNECKDKSKVASSGKCYTPIEGCQSYKTDGTCSSCATSYSLKNGKCETDGCKTKDSTDTTKCVACIDGYYMAVDYKCHKCDAKCDKGCIHTANSCINELTDCFQSNKEGQCIKCESGYKLENGKCVRSSTTTATAPKNDKYECYSKAFDGKCTICRDIAKKELFYATTDGSCNREANNNGTNGITLLFIFVLLMILF